MYAMFATLALFAVMGLALERGVGQPVPRLQRRVRPGPGGGALGSSAGGLVRLLVTESLLVAALGGVAGVVLAWVGLRLGLNLVPGSASSR